MSGTPSGPLKGIRVLDLTAVVLGPLGTQVLADYGAEVIKVEPPGGDMMRGNGVSLHPGMSSIFLALNRNKRSLALDLRTPEGADVLRRLIRGSDVLVHNMRVAAIERLGFGYEAVAAINPGIVYCVATGFDQSGPDADKPAFDDIIQAGSGLAALASLGRDEPDYMPTLVADKTAGMAVANAVLAALVHKARTGQGQHVEVPMLETVAAFVLAEHLGGLTFNPAPAPAGYSRLLGGGRKPARSSDGYICMLPYTADHWRRFFREIARPDLLAVLDSADRTRHAETVRGFYATMLDLGPTRTTAEWLAICERADIPAMPIYGLDDLPEHPQLKASGLFQEMEHPTEGPIRYVRPPTRFAATPAAVHSPAPLVGQQSAEILSEAGFAPHEIADLIARGVVRNENQH